MRTVGEGAIRGSVPTESKPAYRWNKRDGLIDADNHQVVQLVPNYCTNKRRDEIGKILADALNREAQS